MSARQLWADATRLGIKLIPENGHLRVSAPR